MDDDSVAMTLVAGRVARELVISEIVDCAEDIGLVLGIGVGLEMAGQTLSLRQPARPTPLLAA